MRGRGVLTEEEDVLQVLEEGALVLLLLLPGQLLGDHAAVTQPSPQPAGRGGMARGLSEREGLGYPTPCPTPRTCPAFPHCVAHPVGSAHHMLLSLGRNLEKCSLLKALRSPAVAELTPEHPRLILHRTLWSSLRSCPHREWSVRCPHLFSSTRRFSFSTFCCSLSWWFLAQSSSTLWASLWGMI